MDRNSLTPNEPARLAALNALQVMDTPTDPVLDSLTQAAASICGTPIALVSLVDDRRQWFKSRVGLTAQETPREMAFCAHAILQPTELMEVQDTRKDERFRDNPLVTGDPWICFYAGQPLVTSEGHAIGTLCVVDHRARRLTASQRSALARLSDAVLALLIERRDSPFAAIGHAIESTLRSGIVITDPHQPDNPIIYCNSGFEQLTGYTSEETLGRNCRFLAGPDTDDASLEVMRQALMTETECGVTLKNYRKDGTHFWNDVTLSPAHEPGGKLTHFFAIMSDASIAIENTHELNAVKDALEQKVARRTEALELANATLKETINQRTAEAELTLQLERNLLQAQKMESLGVLAGGVAHDFNNMLMGVLGNAELALTDIPSQSPAYARIEDLRQTATHLAELTNQLLAYSGRGKFVVAKTDVSQLISEMHHLLNMSIAKNVTLELQLQHDLPLVEVDAAQIRQIVLNLVINGAEAIGENPGLVRVRTGVRFAQENRQLPPLLDTQLPDGNAVYIEVTDTGIGLSKAEQERIFEPFYTTKFTGRGLGLAAVIGVVRGHNAALRLSSTQGRGCTFEVLLQAATETGEFAGTARPSFGGQQAAECILVIDDEPIVREMVGRMLRRLGYISVIADGGKNGLELLRNPEHRFNLVLLDLTMPEQDGAAVFSQIRKLNKDLPIILSSGYHYSDALQNFTEYDLAGFLQKPYSLGELTQAINEALVNERQTKKSPRLLQDGGSQSRQTEPQAT